MEGARAKWRILVLALGAVVVGIGVGLNENGFDFGRTLFIAGLPLMLGGVLLLVWPRRGVALSVEAPPIDDALDAVAAHWNLKLSQGRASGVVKGRAVTIAVCDGGMTVTASSSRALDMGLTVQRGGKAAGDARKEHTTGDPAFDAEYCVRVDEPGRAGNLLGERLRQQLLSAHASLDDAGVELALDSGDPDVVADAVRLACKVAGELDRASPKVPCAAPLREARDVWLAYAESQKLATAETPLAMWGDIDGLEVQALAVRDAFHQFHFELTANFPQSLARGLELKPGSSATQFDRSGDPIGHPAFDKVFILKAADPVDAARLAGPETREAMLELRDSGLQLRGNDRGLWAWVGFNRSNAALVPEGLSRMVKIAQRIRTNAERFPPTAR